MNPEMLTTARWHLLNTSLPWGTDVTAPLLELLNDKLGYPSPGVPVFPIAPLPKAEATTYIALCLGHARPMDEGNVGAGGVSEEDFNLPLIHALQKELMRRGIRCMTVDIYPPASYSAAMLWLAQELKKYGVTAAIEFHFNAANKNASGHEVLHWEQSVRGVTLARSMDAALTQHFPGHPDRGLKPKSHADRGALFLSLTHCPACIAEPFFGDNPTEWLAFSSQAGVEHLVQAYADGIEQWIESQEAKP